MKNYADRGGCYPPRVKAKVDNVLRDLNSFLHRTTAESRSFSKFSKYFNIISYTSFVSGPYFNITLQVQFH